MGADRADPRDVFGPNAEAYLSSEVHANEAELAYLVSLARPRGGAILDVGTGAGHTAFAFAAHASQVFATDVAEQMLAIVRREAARRGISNVVTAIAPAEELPFPAGEFEGIVCRSAAHHFGNVPEFLAEAYRALTPDGWILVADTVGIDDPGADDALDRIEFQRDPSHARDHTAAAWLKMLADAGFRTRTSEVVPRPMNVGSWLDRLRVGEPTRTLIVEAIEKSDGWLRDYLRPHGVGAALTFHLHQIYLVADKR